MRYRVCYFESYEVFLGKKRHIAKEYPLSFEIAWLRKEYLEKFIKGYVWIEEMKEEDSNVRD
ncbi:MAG: hypothetical protein RR904_00095 [Bacilli bacterium]